MKGNSATAFGYEKNVNSGYRRIKKLLTVNNTESPNGTIQKKPCLENINLKQDRVDKNVSNSAASGIKYSLITKI